MARRTSARSTSSSADSTAAIQAILDAMAWLGLDYEGPYYQMQRLDRYRQLASTQYASEQRFEQADAEHKKATAIASKTRAALTAARRQLDVIDAAFFRIDALPGLLPRCLPSIRYTLRWWTGLRPFRNWK